MNLAFFGSSLVSAYWNGAATYYRGLVRALAGRGHDVTFYERDVPYKNFGQVRLYRLEGLRRAAATSSSAA